MIRWLGCWMCAVLMSVAGIIAVTGCNQSPVARTGSETNWLTACSSDPCAYGSCVCGVCSVACASDSDCKGAPGPARCATASGDEDASACTDGVSGVCLPVCDSATPCPSGQDCVNGACVLTAAAPTGGTLALSGTVAGAPFVPKDAIVAETLTWKSSFYPGSSTVILISDSPNLCASIQSAITPVDSHLVILNLTDVVAGSAQPISTAGTYTLVADPADLSHAAAFTAYYSHVDAQCGFSKGGATSGTLTLSVADPSAPQGFLSVTLDDGGSLSGDFAINQACPTAAVDTYLNRNPTCN